VSLFGLWFLTRPGSVIHFERGMDLKPDFTIIRSLFRFGLPTGVQGIAMNVGGVFMLRFIGSLEHSAAAQAAFAVGYTELFSLITWTSNALMGASATIAGQNLGAGNPDRAVSGVRVASRIGLAVAVAIGALFWLIPEYLLAVFGMSDPDAVSLATHLLRFLSVSGLFVTVALSYTGGLQGTGDTRSPLYISIVSQVISARVLHHPAGRARACRPTTSGSPSCWATWRAVCSVSAFPSAEVAEHPGRHRARTHGRKIGAWADYASFAGIPRVPTPVNDPNKSYLPWSPERAALKARLAEMSGRADRDSAHHRRRGDPHRTAAPGGDAARPRARAGRLARCRERARAARHPGRPPRARGSGVVGVARARGRLHPRRRAARHHVARHHQRRHHARAVEDGVSGRNRRGVGDGRLLALQSVLRAADLRGAADQPVGRVERGGVPAARRLRLRGDAVQLHVDRRQPADGAGAHGQHRGVEAVGHRDRQRLLHHAAARGPRACRPA
jgi:hypothetical protein